MSTVHAREWELRRLRCGELQGAEAERLQEHASGCAHCRSRLRSLEEEQLAFEREISFERFSAGTRFALKGAEIRSRRAWILPSIGLAAAAVLAVLVPSLRDARLPSANRPKGGSEIVLRVAGAGDGPQRNASTSAPEALSTGERVRIGYQTSRHSYLAAISLDEEGHVSAVYPEAGMSLRVVSDGKIHYLPQSLEFTGKGAERVIVILSKQPLAVDGVRRAAQEAYQRSKGDVRHLLDLNVPGEQFHRTLLKP